MPDEELPAGKAYELAFGAEIVEWRTQSWTLERSLVRRLPLDRTIPGYFDEGKRARSAGGCDTGSTRFPPTGRRGPTGGSGR